MLLCSDSIFNLLKRVAYSRLFLCKTLVFLFLPFLNLGGQIRCPKNLSTNVKSTLDQPLVYMLKKQAVINSLFFLEICLFQRYLAELRWWQYGWFTLQYKLPKHKMKINAVTRYNANYKNPYFQSEECKNKKSKQIDF